MVEAGLRVRGRVQGVGFRWWVRAQGTRLGLAGTVHNCDDGTVEVHLRGPASVVDQMTRLLHDGPPGARVDTVDSVPFREAPGAGFSILR
ncbi:MAG: acylphosphatase [Gemmatimonadetes bacterium]|nr:acylphosphatase [Gemmatimonadota bacterium]